MRIVSLLNRDTAKIVRELNNALAFNEKLASIASQADAGDLVPGIGPISVLGMFYPSRPFCCYIGCERHEKWGN